MADRYGSRRRPLSASQARQRSTGGGPYLRLSAVRSSFLCGFAALREIFFVLVRSFYDAAR